MLIGKVGKPYGILGWVTVFSFAEEKEKIFTYLPWFFFKENTWNYIIVEDWKKYKNNFIIRIKGISDRSIIKNFTNSSIMISKNTLPELKKNNYYWHDIINCQVFNMENNYLGQVKNIIRTKNNDILIIKNSIQVFKKNILIPFIENKIIKNININDKLIIVQWKTVIYSK